MTRQPGKIVREQLEGSKEEAPGPGPGKGLLARQLAEQNLTEWAEPQATRPTCGHLDSSLLEPQLVPSNGQELS